MLLWYEQERKDIPVPGRMERDPYAIWIAEVMLQQTQVSTVWPYYKKWMASFPSIAVLAKAQEDQVLKQWEGLGYYSRARNLHKAAQLIRTTHGGALPGSSEGLLSIPGIGPYTAAAIASIAFNEAVPLIDGNVLRVMTRLEKNTGDITKARTKTKITEKLRGLISREKPGDFNQALMDLGRTICKPKNPNCHQCPVSDRCLVFKIGQPDAYPVKPARKATPHYQVVIGLIRRKEKLLIQRRPAKGLLGGLWEFPGGKIETGESDEEALLREIREETGLEVQLGEKIGTIQHAYTHFQITMTAYFCDSVEGESQTLAATENRWVKFEQLEDFAFPKANLKILALLNKANLNK